MLRGVAACSCVLFLASCAGVLNSETPSEEKFTLIPQEQFVQSVQMSYDLAENWFLRSFRDKGIFHYLYDPQEDSFSLTNNMVRQLMASRLLAEMSQTMLNLREKHKQNLNFIFQYWYRETEDGKFGYIRYNRKSKLGANAMALRTVVHSPFFEEYSEEARKLADGILSLLHEGGSFDPWFIEPDYAYDKDYILTFYSGEAILALVEYGQMPGNETYLEAAQKAQDFYITRYVKNLDENYYPAYVPWHTLALNKLYMATGDEKYVEPIFILNDKLLELQDTQDFVGRFYNPETPQYGKPHSASDGVYTEGLAYAYEIALQTGDTAHQEKYYTALQLAVQNLRSLQYTDETIPQNFSAERVKGGFPARAGAYMLRIDNTQHTLDAYRKILKIFTL